MSSTYSSYLKDLQILQNKAVKILSNGKWSEHVTPYYYQNKILKLEDLILFETAKLMHQQLSGSLPTPTKSYFSRTNTVHNHYTRSSSNNSLVTPTFTSVRTQRSLKYVGLKIWNSIPQNIKTLSYARFQKELKIYYLNKYNQSTN